MKTVSFVDFCYCRVNNGHVARESRPLILAPAMLTAVVLRMAPGSAALWSTTMRAISLSPSIRARRRLPTYFMRSNFRSWVRLAVEIPAFSNPWGEHVGISTGENALINTWGTGATPGTFSGGVWTMGSGVSYDAGGTGSTFATMTVPLSSLGVECRQTVSTSTSYHRTCQLNGRAVGLWCIGQRDRLSRGDGCLAISLGIRWSESYYDSAPMRAGTKFGTAASLYTVVPEPATCALLGLGGLLMIIRRRISSAR